MAQGDIKIEETIRGIFPAFQEYKVREHIIDNQQVQLITVIEEKQILGWAVVLEEMGKIRPITFLVGIDKENRVVEVKVLEYRDLFGSEIRRRSFLKQFRGKSLKDRLLVGRDIDAVTSATISSEAATSAVRKSLRAIAEIDID